MLAASTPVTKLTPVLLGKSTVTEETFVPVATDDVIKQIDARVIEPTIRGMKKAGIPFKGVLISCDIFAKKVDFAFSAISAFFLSCSKAVISTSGHRISNKKVQLLSINFHKNCENENFQQLNNCEETMK